MVVKNKKKHIISTLSRPESKKNHTEKIHKLETNHMIQ